MKKICKVKDERHDGKRFTNSSELYETKKKEELVGSEYELIIKILEKRFYLEDDEGITS